MHKFATVGDNIIPLKNIIRIEIGEIEQEHVVVVTEKGRYDAYGFDAIELVMLIKPSAVEGRRVRFKKHSWAVHNIIGHPLMQLLTWIGFKETAIWIHDATTPTMRNYIGPKK